MSDIGSDQREFWDRRADAWERHADALNAFSNVYGLSAMDALDVRPGERVLDIGCGSGTTAIELAKRVAPNGEVVGVDIAPGMVAGATRRASAAGVTNARFVVANVQTDDLGRDLDAAFSRFGVMFFPDPAAAFSNIARSLRPGGRLGCAVWSGVGDNPWMFVPTFAAGPVLGGELAIPGPNEPGPFSLADRDRLTGLLAQAGFVETAIEVVAGARLITAASADEDVRTLLEVGPLGDAYNAAQETTRQAAVDAVLAAVEPYRDADGWRLPGAALRVLAHRP